jgi:pimeloyl-ACP methyl ester carboxylesterase
LLISGGKRDIFHERLNATRALISACKTAVIEGGGDLVPLEKPDEFARLVLDFLSNACRRRKNQSNYPGKTTAGREAR